MGSHVVVRPLRAGELRGPLVDFLVDQRHDLNWSSDPAALRRRVADVERADLLLLALDGGVVVGIAALTRGTSDASRHAATLRVHVRAEYRSAGVGSKLLRRALFWADRNGIERVVGTPYMEPGIPAESRRVIAFFRLHGFELEGFVRKAARLLDGTLVDGALMARVTASAGSSGSYLDWKYREERM